MGAVINDLSVLSVFLLAGLALRETIKPLQKLFLPAGLIGGVCALILGPQVLGWVALPKGWGGMIGPMINVVLTCLIFGTVVNRSRLKSFAGSVVIVALTYFAQMFVGAAVGQFLRGIWPALPKGWGVMAVFTYWGGHGAGTAAGKLFETLGEAEAGMLSIGIILATLGLVMAMLAGMTLVNYGIRKGWATNLSRDLDGGVVTLSGPLPLEKQKSLGNATVASDALNGLALQLALVLFCMWLGGCLFGTLKRVFPATKSIPSLVYGMIGALIVWALMVRFRLEKYADKKAVNTLSGLALEICICAATATLNLKVFASFFVPILIHMTAILAVMIFVCVVLTRRWFKENWFETCLLFFGQGLGSAPSGLALARCVDPETQNTAAWEGFGVASGCFAPISSALVAVIPLLTVKNELIPLGIGAVLSIALVVCGELLSRRD